MQRIIVHGGKAHFDEVFALGIMLNMEFGNSDVSNFPEVHRRDPSQNELDNPDVAVIDVGGEYDPSKNNFDHHQDEDLYSSFRLVAANYNLVGDDITMAKTVDQVLKEGTRWYEYKDLLDRRGPNKAAHSVGVHGDTKPLVSPIESWLIDQFRETEAGKEIVGMVAVMVKDWIERALSVSERLEEFEREGRVEQIGDLGVLVIDREPDSFVIDQLRDKESFGDFDATISRNPRAKDFWGAYRYPEVDLDLQEAAYSLFGEDVIDAEENDLFAHNNGFFSVVSSQEDARDLFREAIYNSDTYSGAEEPSSS